MGVGNKFATMLHRNTNKTIVILVYAFLEWLLISLLLLNSLFTYLITKYTDFFGLKHSCIFCSTASLGSVCDNHAAEISKISYCVRQHCSMEKWQQEEEERDPNPNSYNNIDYANRVGIVIEELDGDGVDDEANKADDEEHQMIISDVDSFGFREASEEECSKSLSNFRWHENEECHNNYTLLLPSSSHVEDDSFQLIDLQFMRTTHYSDNCSESLRLVPVDLIDSSMLIGENHQTLTTNSVMNLLDVPPQVEEGDRHTQAAHHNTEEATDEEELHKETTLLEKDGESGQVKPFTIGAGKDEVQDSTNEEQLEARENEPETPTSLDSLQSLHKKLLLLSEKRESSVEESVDGSFDGGDGALTVERLKSALTSERKTLRAVYAELEEERSASAIAANHTMAMITRLQEEKAAMQMEALQYQRMMEEQAEYDQEALQLLNNLMLKREKEKDELAKELEMYRRDQINVIDQGDYYSDDDDDARLSIDLNRAILIEKPNDDNNYVGSNPCAAAAAAADGDDEDDEDGELEEMALDCMKHMSELDESLAEFEEEKLSILDQLKALEEKLLMMSSGEGEGSEEVIIEKEETMQLQSMAKQLLPLLDEAEDETAEMEINSVEEEAVEVGPIQKVVDAVEEVDRVYERLQALEEESVKEDEQGMNLLQEILQNLRDLKSVELRVQNSTGGIA